MSEGSSRLGAMLRAPLRAVALLIRGDRQLSELRALSQKLSKATSEVGGTARRTDARVEKQGDRISAVKRELESLRRDMSAELQRVNMQLSATIRALQQVRAPSDGSGNGHPARLSGRVVPLDVAATEWEWTPIAGGDAHPDPKGEQWLTCESCPFCGHAGRTVVNEFNKLILMDKAPDDNSARYDFALCHACGIVYATRRPFGERYKYLLANFGEVTAKHGGDREFTNPLLNPYPLTDRDREELKTRASKGVFVSEHLGLRSKDYLEGLFRDRLENSVHLDLLTALVPPHNGRVLEIRPRTGMISEGLRRLCGADVYAMPIWESQRYLLKEVYGIDSAGLVDYDHFTIPYDGQFDLIVCNHMLTHAVRPPEFFGAMQKRLKAGGHIYFYNEPDDSEFLAGNQSMFATLNPLHMQAFDMASFIRGLAANGLEVVFHRHRNLNHMSLARLAPTTFTPMTDDERDRRIALYQRARDRAILASREHVRPRFADEWPQALERGLAAGVVEFDAKGSLRLTSQ